MKKITTIEKIFILFLLTVSVIALIIVGIQWKILHDGARSLEDQVVSKRWAENSRCSQISCYFKTDQVALNDNDIMQLRYQIENAYSKTAVAKDSSSTNFYIDSYCANQSVKLERNGKAFDCNAYLVGGNFFEFHRLNLVNGSYFDEDEVMDDYVILDRETAWNLFGSDDVEGMDVYLDGYRLKVRGVYERSHDKLEEYAGDDKPSVFIRYSRYRYIKEQGMAASLNSEDSAMMSGTSLLVDLPHISCYEIVMVNPVKNFAYGEIVSNTLETAYKDKYILLENSERFSYASYKALYKASKGRSMVTEPIAYPYWENYARAVEDKLMPVAIVQLRIITVLIVTWLIAIIVFIVRHKPTKENFVALFEKIGEGLRKAKKTKKKVEEVINEHLDTDEEIDSAFDEADNYNNQDDVVTEENKE